MLVQKPTGFVYIWYDTIRKMYCIGSHLGDLNDGYITSTGIMNKAFNKRPETFKRKILEYYYGECQKELFNIEQYYLNMIKDEELFLKENIKSGSVRYYNIKKNASGLSGKVASKIKKSWWDSDKSDNWRKELSNKMKINNPVKKGNIPWNKGKKAPQISESLKGKSFMTDEGRKKLSQRNKDLWGQGVYNNRPKPSKETKKKISDSLKGKKQSEYQKQRASETHKGKNVSKETREKIRINAIQRAKEVVICPHCNKSGNGPIMRRWHFSNCKFK